MFARYDLRGDHPPWDHLAASQLPEPRCGYDHDAKPMRSYADQLWVHLSSEFSLAYLCIGPIWRECGLMEAAMEINAYWYKWGWAWDSGGDGTSASARVSFDPQYGYAQTSLSFADGGGYTGTGITHYETRPDANGPNVPTDFNWDPNFGYPPAIDADQLTEVTFEIDVGGSTALTALLTVFLFD